MPTGRQAEDLRNTKEYLDRIYRITTDFNSGLKVKSLKVTKDYLDSPPNNPHRQSESKRAKQVGRQDVG
jgi:hypothetical protein